MKAAKPLLFLLFLSPLAFGETKGHQEILEATGARLLWDGESKKGIFIKGGRTITFFADEPILLIDGREVRYTGAIIYDRGNLKFSKDTADFVIQFYKGQTLEEKKEPPFKIAAIILDPGHGGRDSGALSRYPVDGVAVPLLEKNHTLDAALALEEMLQKKYKDKDIILTRRNDEYPSLEERVKIANDYPVKEEEGILYISLHANASLNTEAQGFEVWHLPEDFSRQVYRGPGELPYLKPIFNSLLEEEFIRESQRLARYILNRMDEGIGHLSPNRGIKAESWFVVRNAMMASVLIETGFISNREESGRLREPGYLQKLYQSIYNGIVDFVDFFEKQEKI